MESSFFQQGDTPIVATLANWAPKCNNELETRVRLDFEVPLSAELIELAPASIRNAALAIGNLEGGLTQGVISSEYDQTIEVYPTPDHKTPFITFPNVKLIGVEVFRPTPKEGPSKDLFLTFNCTVKAEGPFGDLLVCWALKHNRRTVFFRAFDVQASLPLSDATAEKPAGKRRSGKDAAANEPVAV